MYITVAQIQGDRWSSINSTEKTHKRHKWIDTPACSFMSSTANAEYIIRAPDIHQTKCNDAHHQACNLIGCGEQVAMDTTVSPHPPPRGYSLGDLPHELPGRAPGVIVGGLPNLGLDLGIVHHHVGAARGRGGGHVRHRV